MSKIKRAQGLASAKTTTQSKTVKIDGFKQLVDELKSITLAQEKSNASLSKSLNQLSQVILTASDSGVDLDSVVKAIDSLKEKLTEKNMPHLPSDYEIHFERDKFNLMKSGIKLTSVQRKLN